MRWGGSPDPRPTPSSALLHAPASRASLGGPARTRASAPHGVGENCEAGLEHAGLNMKSSTLRILAVAAILLLPLVASAEIVCALGTATSAYKPSADERPSADTMQIVRRVDAAFASICLPKCPEVAMLRNPTAANVMLIATKDDAKLVYSPQFFAGVYAKYGEAGIVALIAHVYGHAIDEATQPTWIPANWNPELRADAWAGCVLAKTSLPASGIRSALGAMAMSPPPSQPAWSPRVPAVRLGFTHCGGATATFDAASSVTKAK